MVHGYAWVVSGKPSPDCDPSTVADDWTEDYALMEASYAVVRILQTYLNIRLPPGEQNLPVGGEKHNLTIVMSSAEGCKVLLE